MKKRSFGLVLLLSVLVIVIALYLFATSVAKRDNDDDDDESTAIVYVDRLASEVTKLTYRTDDGGYEFSIVKSGSTYVLESDENFPLDMTVVEFMTNATAQVIFERRINPEGDDLTEYGLDDAHTVITAAYKDGAKLTLSIGHYNKYSDAYYCSVGDGFVYLISGDFTDAFEYTFTDLLLDDSAELPQDGFSSLTDIEITYDSGTVIYSLVEGEDGEDDIWTKKNADGTVEDSDFTSAAKLIYNELYMVQLEEWVAYNAKSDETLDTYGLKKPEVRVLFRHIETKDISADSGSSTVTKEYERTTAFLIGSRTDAVLEGDDGAKRFFMIGGGTVVYVLDEADLPEVLGNIK